ncbi:MAG: hypothetical protein GY850_43945 [bacterium]|nr:hypothetical protein [bacterium]
MIIRGGENIYPAQLEEILYRVPGIAEAALVDTYVSHRPGGFSIPERLRIYYYVRSVWDL